MDVGAAPTITTSMTALLHHTHLLLLFVLCVFDCPCIRIVASSLRRGILSSDAAVFPVVYSTLPAAAAGGGVRSTSQLNIHMETVGGARLQLLLSAPEIGQYVAFIGVGDPAAALPMIVDTGSELSWLRCRPKGDRASFIFDPSQSATFSSPTSCTTFNDSSYSSSCFTTSYADGSTASGSLASDTLSSPALLPQDTIAYDEAAITLHLTTTTMKPRLRHFIFGCSRQERGVESAVPAAGVLGLDRGPLSLLSQLPSPTVFSYCLPSSSSSPAAATAVGFLSLATIAPLPLLTRGSSLPLLYTPLIHNLHSPFSSQFYYLNLTAIAVDFQQLSIPTSAFVIDAVSGGGGTIIDSGTALTILVEEAFEPLARAVDAAIDPRVERVRLMQKLAVDGGQQSSVPCYRVAEPPAGPVVRLMFEGGAEIRVGGASLFFRVVAASTMEGGGRGGGGYYCLAVTGGEAAANGGRNLVGHFQQKDVFVEYDIGRSRVGFAPAPSCSQLVHYSGGPPSLEADVWALTLTWGLTAYVCLFWRSQYARLTEC